MTKSRPGIALGIGCHHSTECPQTSVTIPMPIMAAANATRLARIDMMTSPKP
jgi:hypothetical protein